MPGFAWGRDGWRIGASAGLEALWAGAWLNVLLAATAGSGTVRVGLPWVVMLLAGPALAGRWLEARGGDPTRRRLWLLALAGALALLCVAAHVTLGVPPWDVRALVAALAPWQAGGPSSGWGTVVCLWLGAGLLVARGVWLALGDVTPAGARQWFLGGLGAFLALFGGLAAGGVPADAAEQGRLGLTFAAYVLLGLGWLAGVQRQALAVGTRDAGRAGTWMLLMGGASLVLLALALGGLAAATMLGGFGDRLAALGDQVQAGIVTVARQAVALWLLVLRSLPSRGPVEPPATRPPATPTPTPGPARTPDLAFPDVGLPFEVPWGLVLALGALAVAAAWVLTRPTRPAAGPAADEEHTSLWSWGLLWDWLGGLWRGRRAPRRGAEPAARGESPPPPDSVRGLYRAALAWSAAQGRARPPAATPREFESALAEGLSEELAHQLTAAYVQVRYGERGVADAEVSRLRAAWARRMGRPPTA